MEYNLVRNAQLSYSINNGYYNRILTADEVLYISDNDTSFENSILVSGTEYLIFESSFNRRIKIDRIKLYLYSTTTSGNTLDHLNFYYSNDNELDYEIVTDKFIGDNNFYYVDLPFPSAPMKVKVTVSGLDCSISEYFISNDEYPVGFGKDGDLSKLYITRTDDNDRTIAQQLEIYNRNTNSLNDLVSAYVCIDYTGTLGDNYLKISDKSDSGFIGVDDNIFIENNLLDNDYIWDMGRFDNTKISDEDNLVLDLETYHFSLRSEIPHPDTPGTDILFGNYIFAEDELKTIVYATISDYYLKLYEYNYIYDTWNFIGKINPGCTGWEQEHSMCRIDNYIYVLINNQCEFGRYDLNGQENNWEVLETPPIHTPVSDNDRFCICSDKKEYIYFISYIDHAGDPAINSDANFACYSTISGSVAGWESLSNTYEHGEGGAAYYIRCSLHYDIDHNCLYFMSGYTYYIKYICRYDINTQVWDNSWLYIDQYIDLYYNVSLCYKNNNIYIINYQHVYCYDVVHYTFELLSNTYFDYVYTNNPCIIAVNSLVMNQESQLIFAGVAVDHNSKDNINWYNGPSSGGSYTTPVLDIIDSYKSSYFLIDYELQQNTTVTSAKFEDTNLMELKSSDSTLLSIEGLYFSYNGKISYFNLYTGSVEHGVIQFANTLYGDSFLSCDINNITGEVCMATTWTNVYYLTIFNYDRSIKIEIHSESGTEDDFRTTAMKFDSVGGVYTYDGSEDVENPLFSHYDSSLNILATRSEGILTSGGMKYIKDFCAGEDATVWYIHEGNNQLVHKDTSLDELNNIVLDSPHSLERDYEGGVWVVYSNQMKIIKYSKYYNIELTISFNTPVDKISSDMDGGLWVIQGLILKYISKDSTIVKSFLLSNTPTWITAGRKSCLLYNNTINIGYFFRYPDGLIKEVVFDHTQYHPPLFFCYGYEEELINKKNYLPVSYDPNWGTNGTIEWEDVQLNGYYLPKNKYHQLKITLKSSKYENTPKVKKIKITPCIKLVDIQKNTYKSVYLKLDVPNQFKNITYDTKIKCWWEDKE